MKSPKLAIFDMDGLLINSERVFMNLKGEIMVDYGYHQTEEEYIRTLGTSGDRLHAILIDAYGPDYPADEITEKTRVKVAEYYQKEGVPVKEGIPELLQGLREKGIPCCVATSTHREYATSYLKIAGLFEYFDFFICGDEISHPKPNPEIFLKACDQGHTKPEDALVFEDSENGILAADTAGIPVICIPDMKYPNDQAAALTAAIVKDAHEALNLL